MVAILDLPIIPPCCWPSQMSGWPLESRCYLVYKLKYTSLFVCFLLIAANFDLPVTPTSESINNERRDFDPRITKPIKHVAYYELPSIYALHIEWYSNVVRRWKEPADHDIDYHDDCGSV